MTRVNAGKRFILITASNITLNYAPISVHMRIISYLCVDEFINHAFLAK